MFGVKITNIKQKALVWILIYVRFQLYVYKKLINKKKSERKLFNWIVESGVNGKIYFYYNH